MQCSKCGASVREGQLFCENCGTPVANQKPDEQQNQNQNVYQNQNQNQYQYQNQNQTQNAGTTNPTYYQQANQQPQYNPANQAPNKQDRFDYTPISMWGYFGYEILFSIPCIGLILLLVFSFGGTKNINLRNFARSFFCIFILAIVIALIIVIVGAVTGTLYYTTHGVDGIQF